MAKNLDMIMLLDFYGDMLTAKQREFISFYYNDDLSLAEIAENAGITRQGVRDAIKRAESQLIEMEERVGFVSRFEQVKAGLSKSVQKPAETMKKILNAVFRGKSTTLQLKFSHFVLTSQTPRYDQYKGYKKWHLKVFQTDSNQRLKS